MMLPDTMQSGNHQAATPTPQPEHAGRANGPSEAPGRLTGVTAEIREGDGVDPRDEAKRRLRARRTGPPGRQRGAHRQQRFAAQVADAIESALRLATEPLLNALTVREVVQQGGSLLVVTEPRNPDLPLDISAATRALQNATSMLTREVAREITRKESPILNFIVLPAGAERLED